MTAAELQTAIADLEAAADIALPLLGHAEAVPIADALGALAAKVAAAVEAKKPATTLAAEVQAAETAADVAEDAKVGPARNG